MSSKLAVVKHRGSKKKAAPHNSIAIVVPPSTSDKNLCRPLSNESRAHDEERAYAVNSYPAEYFRDRVLQPSWLVQTPYGPGQVQACRLLEAEPDDDHDDCVDEDAELSFSDSKKSKPKYKYFIRLDSGSESTRRLITLDNYPSVEPKIGSEVVLTCFRHCDRPQRGRVVQLRPHLHQAVVRLVTWRLLHRTGPPSLSAKSSQQRPQQQQQPHPRVAFVTCFLNYHSLQVVAPKPVDAMTAYETLLYVHERQQLAYEQYSARNHGAALLLYEAAVEALQSLLVQRRHESVVQGVRGNLILTQIRCGNQAAVAAWHQRNHQGVVGHAMTSLKLLRALEKKKEEANLLEASAGAVAAPNPDSHRRQHHERRVGEMRVFGVWRIKAMQLLALALMKFRQWEHARDIVMQAHKVVLKYAHSDDAPPPPSSAVGGQRSTFREFLRRKAQLLRVDKSLLKLYAKIEQRRRTAGRRNFEDRSIVIEQCPSADSNVDNVSDLDDADWLDEDEERDMAADWQPMAAMVVGDLDGVPVSPPPPPRMGSLATLVTTESSSDDVPALAVSSGQSIVTAEQSPVDAVAQVNAGKRAADGTSESGAARFSESPAPLSQAVVVSEDTAKKPHDYSSESTTEHPIVTDSDDDSTIEEDDEIGGTAAVGESSSLTGKPAHKSTSTDTGALRMESENGPILVRDVQVSTKLEYASDAAYSVDNQADITRLLVEKREALESEAAIRIQSLARAVVARSVASQRRAAVASAAKSIQSWYRGDLRKIQFRSVIAAVVVLQSLVRGFLCRKRAREVERASKLAAKKIQACFRQWVETTAYQRRRNAAVHLQSALRRFLISRRARTFQFKANRAATQIQAAQRGRVGRKQFLVQRAASHDIATKLCALYRSRKQEQRYELLKDSAVRIQTIARALNAKRVVKSMLDAVVVIQACARIHLLRKKYKAYKLQARVAATKIQALQRGKTLQRRYFCQRAASVRLQAFARSIMLARSYSRTRHLITAIQALARARIVRISGSSRLQAAVTLQALSRGFLVRRSFLVHELEATAAAIKIQALHRGSNVRLRFASWKNAATSASITIQACYRGHLLARRFSRLVQAVVRIQSVARAAHAKSLSCSRIRAIVSIQSLVRVHLARREVHLYRKQAISAATRIQALQRKKAAQQRYAGDRAVGARAAATIQSWYKGRVQARSYSQALASLIRIQSHARAKRARMERELRIQSLVVSQSAVRAFLARREFCILRDRTLTAATKIQALQRSKLVQDKYRLRRDAYRLASTRIQAMVRRHANVVRYSRTLVSVIQIQAIIRMHGQRKDYLCILYSAVVLQSIARAFLSRARHRRLSVVVNNAATRIQAGERGRVARFRCCLARDSRYAAATELQAFLRSRIQAKKYARVMQAVVKIQSNIRLRAHRSAYLSTLERLALLQALARGYKARRDFQFFRSCAIKTAILLQSVQRGRVVRKLYSCAREAACSAATTIQARIRCFLLFRRYQRLKATANASARRIQAVHRGRILRTRMHKEHAATVHQYETGVPFLGDMDETKITSDSRQTTEPQWKSLSLGITSSRNESKHFVGDCGSKNIPAVLCRRDNQTFEGNGDDDDDETVASEEASNATSPFFDAASQQSAASDAPSLNSGRYSVVSAPAYLLSKASRSATIKRPPVRKAFVDTATLHTLKTHPRTPLRTDESRNAPVAPTILEVDDTSVISEDASQITAASAYFDAASQQSEDCATSDIASLNSGYSRFSVVSAPAFVRSEIGHVRDQHGNLTSARKVFVDAATLKKLQKRSRSKPSTSSKRKHKPFIAPHLMDELTEASANSVQSSRFPPVYEEPPDDQWRDEIKVFAPKARKASNHEAIPTPDVRDLLASKAPDFSTVEIDVDSGNRRVSFAQDVVFAETFTGHAPDAAESSEETEVRPRRRAWFQTREFRAGVGTLVAGGASIGTMLAAKLMSKGK